MAAVKLFALTLIVGLLAACMGAGNGVCNNRSVKECRGEWVGTECGPSGRGYTCTDNGNGGIVRPECDCVNGQGDPPPDEKGPVDRAGRPLFYTTGEKIPVEKRETY